MGFVIGLAASLLAAAVLATPGYLRRRKVKGALPAGSDIHLILGGKYPDGVNPDALYVHSHGLYAVSRLAALTGRFGVKFQYLIDREMDPRSQHPYEVCVGGLNSNTRTAAYLESFWQCLFVRQGQTVNPREARIVKFSAGARDGYDRTVVLIYGSSRRDTDAAVDYFASRFADLVEGIFKQTLLVLLLRVAPSTHDVIEVVDQTTDFAADFGAPCPPELLSSPAADEGPESAPKPRQDRQAVADALSEIWKDGVDRILNRAFARAGTQDEINDVQASAHGWLRGALAAMLDLGCTTQEILHVEYLHLWEPILFRPDNPLVNKYASMHSAHLQRLREIIDKYAD